MFLWHCMEEMLEIQRAEPVEKEVNRGAVASKFMAERVWQKQLGCTSLIAPIFCVTQQTTEEED